MTFTISTHGGNIRVDYRGALHLIFRRDDLIAFHVTNDHAFWSIDWVFRTGAFRTQYARGEDCAAIATAMGEAFMGSGYDT